MMLSRLSHQRIVILLGLAVIIIAGIIVRIQTSEVLARANQVEFYGSDPYYHMRRIRLILDDFPHVPYVDRFCEFPLDIKCHTWPGGFDLFLAGLARVGLGANPAPTTLEWFLAYAIPVIGALAAIALYLVSRQVAGFAISLIGAAVYVLLPATIVHGEFARVDHHVLDPFLALLIVFTYLRGRHAALWSRNWWAWVVGGSAVGGVAIASIPAAASYLVHFGLVCGLDMTILALRLPESRRWRVSWVTGTMLLLLCGLWGALYFLSTPCWGIPGSLDFSPIVLLILGVGCFALLGLGGIFTGLQQRGRLSWRALAAVALLIALTAIITILSVPEGEQLAARWLSFLAGNKMRLLTNEFWDFLSRPLFLLMWNFSPLLFAAPIGILTMAGTLVATQRSKSPSNIDGPRIEALTTLLGWTALAFALGFVQAGYFRGIVAAAIALAVVWLTDRFIVWRWSIAPREHLQEGNDRVSRTSKNLSWGRALFIVSVIVGSIAWTLDNFSPLPHDASREQTFETLRWIKANTPPVDFETGAVELPAYGVLAEWQSGHWINYIAERPSIATPFMPPRMLAAARKPGCERGLCRWIDFLLADSETKAQAVLDVTRSRYIIINYNDPGKLDRYLPIRNFPTDPFLNGRDPRPEYWSLINLRLYALNGSAAQMPGVHIPALGHFRLRYCSEAQHDPLAWGQMLPLTKVFEYLPTVARAVGTALPNTQIIAELPLVDGWGRSSIYIQVVHSDAQGKFEIFLPYAQSGLEEMPNNRAVRPLGAYLLSIGAQSIELSVSEAQIRSGDIIKVLKDKENK